MSDTPRGRTHTETLADLADAVAELTEPIQHTERYEIRKKNYYLRRAHQSTHPPLLQQLRECAYHKPHAPTDQADNPMPRNTPRLDLDALNRLDAINVGVSNWRLEFDLKPRGKKAAQDLLWHTQEMTKLFDGPLPRPIARIRAIAAMYAAHVAGMVEPDLKALVGVAATLDRGQLGALERDVARWRTWCRIVAGWETRPWQPHARCPHCEVMPGERAGLRVRAEIQAAVCLSCSTTWDPEGVPIAVLGEHIRQIREAVDAGRQAALGHVPPTSEHQNRGGRG